MKARLIKAVPKEERVYTFTKNFCTFRLPKLSPKDTDSSQRYWKGQTSSTFSYVDNDGEGVVLERKSLSFFCSISSILSKTNSIKIARDIFNTYRIPDKNITFHYSVMSIDGEDHPHVKVTLLSDTNELDLENLSFAETKEFIISVKSPANCIDVYRVFPLACHTWALWLFTYNADMNSKPLPNKMLKKISDNIKHGINKHTHQISYTAFLSHSPSKTD